jgi:hypothetical protein
MLIGALIAWVVGPMWLLDHGYITEGAKRASFS